MNETCIDKPAPIKGRGAVSNASGRFESRQRAAFDDGWDYPPDDSRPQTVVQADASRSILAYNESPDVPFDRSLNPYRGCEHGCVYCFARPTHAYLGLSPGLATLLDEALSRPAYRCQPLALGVNTDAYQPIERKLGITRSVLEVLQRFRHPVSIITKSALVERDVDILREMAQDRLVSVAISITTLEAELARKLEPRAATPHRRLQTIRTLAAADIPVNVLVAPLIPVLTDPELEAILEAATEAGAQSAGYILLRLPLACHDARARYPRWQGLRKPLR
jgi:DNA repair photolyase